MRDEMLELTHTRANEMIDPSLHVWGWEIPVYLFLGGLVAGMMIITGWFLYSGRQRSGSCVCLVLPTLGIALLSIGMLALFLDLEHKLFVWRLYTTFQPSAPMSWGSWILLLVYPVLFASLLLHPPAWLAARLPALSGLSERLAARPGLVRSIAALSMALGGLLGIYTGILLSALGARPLWSSGLLGPLFLVSGLSTAAALVHLIARDEDERVLLAKADNGFLATELVLITLFVISMLSASRVHMEAIGLVLGGPFTAVFWVFVVGLGILIPLLIQSLSVNDRIQHTPVAPLLVLAGGMVLRIVMVSAGQASHWSTF